MNGFTELADVLARIPVAWVDDIERIGIQAAGTVKSGGTLYFCGNGGSASESQHLATEITGRFVRTRRGYSGIALTSDTSTLTAIGNDFGFDEIFARQVEAHCKEGDMLFGLSTSGNSTNVVNAFKRARDMGVFTVGMTAESGGELKAHSDHVFKVPSTIGARVQEIHLLVGHMICDVADRELAMMESLE